MKVSQGHWTDSCFLGANGYSIIIIVDSCTQEHNKVGGIAYAIEPYSAQSTDTEHSLFKPTECEQFKLSLHY